MAKKNEVNENENPVRGRAAFLEMMQGDNPEYNPADDDVFLDDVYSRYSRDKGDLESLRGANDRLSELVGKDPRLGLFFSSLVDEKNPKSVPFALASVYGNILDLDDEALLEYEDGYKENLAKVADNRKAMERAVQNFAESKERIMGFAEANGLPEEERAQLEAAIYDTADNLLEGVIPDWLIDTIHKGLTYERDMQQTADTSYVEGKNQAVEAKLRKRQKNDGLPDLATGTGAGGNRQLPSPKKGKRDFFDALKD